MSSLNTHMVVKLSHRMNEHIRGFAKEILLTILQLPLVRSASRQAGGQGRLKPC